jgi:hypothetical protein
MLLLNTACFGKMSERIAHKSAGLNGDFEVSQSGYPVNWILYTPKTVPHSDFDMVVDKTDFSSGKQSLKFVVRECSSIGGWKSPGLTSEIEAEPGVTYKVSFWAKNKGSQFRFMLGGVSAKEGQYGVNVTSSDTMEIWQKIEYEFTVPGNYSRLRLELNITKPGVFQIDDLKVEKAQSKTK